MAYVWKDKLVSSSAEGGINADNPNPECCMRNKRSDLKLGNHLEVCLNPEENEENCDDTGVESCIHILTSSLEWDKKENMEVPSVSLTCVLLFYWQFVLYVKVVTLYWLVTIRIIYEYWKHNSAVMTWHLSYLPYIRSDWPYCLASKI
jgi:hypothetical protein